MPRATQRSPSRLSRTSTAGGASRRRRRIHRPLPRCAQPRDATPPPVRRQRAAALLCEPQCERALPPCVCRALQDHLRRRGGRQQRVARRRARRVDCRPQGPRGRDAGGAPLCRRGGQAQDRGERRAATRAVQQDVQASVSARGVRWRTPSAKGPIKDSAGMSWLGGGRGAET
eukprot:418792-Prymnesium_polylepis.1